MITNAVELNVALMRQNDTETRNGYSDFREEVPWTINLISSHNRTSQ